MMSKKQPGLVARSNPSESKGCRRYQRLRFSVKPAKTGGETLANLILRIYSQCADNFADLRQRFESVLSRARQVLDWPQNKQITLIMDRGIFGMEVFEKILAEPLVHLITWEKGYDKGQWCVNENRRKSAGQDSSDLLLSKNVLPG